MPYKVKDLVYKFLYEDIHKRRNLEIDDDIQLLIVNPLIWPGDGLYNYISILKFKGPCIRRAGEVNCDETSVYYEEPETK